MTKKAVKEEQGNKTWGIQKTQSKIAHSNSINNITHEWIKEANEETEIG